MTYTEVWTNDPPPGGFICSQCGMPVESEPCPDHDDGENPLAREFLRGVRRFRLERGLGDAKTNHPERDAAQAERNHLKETR